MKDDSIPPTVEQQWTALRTLQSSLRVLNCMKPDDTPLSVGQHWSNRSIRDPFGPQAGELIATILELKSGWVRYSTKVCGSTFSDQRKTEEDFRTVYETLVV